MPQENISPAKDLYIDSSGADRERLKEEANDLDAQIKAEEAVKEEGKKPLGKFSDAKIIPLHKPGGTQKAEKIKEIKKKRESRRVVIRPGQKPVEMSASNDNQEALRTEYDDGITSIDYTKEKQPDNKKSKKIEKLKMNTNIRTSTDQYGNPIKYMPEKPTNKHIQRGGSTKWKGQKGIGA